MGIVTYVDVLRCFLNRLQEDTNRVRGEMTMKNAKRAW